MGWVRSVLREQLVPPVLGELVARLVPWALALPEHLAGWVHSVLRESAV